jgi:hypothetical protein
VTDQEMKDVIAETLKQLNREVCERHGWLDDIDHDMPEPNVVIEG